MSAAPEVPAVDAADTHRRVDRGAVLLDVREPDEWHAGHAPGALWIPLGDLGARQDELSSDRPIVVVCRSGVRSAKATGALRQAGFDATNLAGGMQAWADAGYSVVTDEGEPGAVA